MSKDLRTFYFVLHGSFIKGTWGRGKTIADALQAAKIKWNDKPRIIAIHVAPETPDAVFEQLYFCWSVNDYGELKIASDCTDDDVKAIADYLIGYSYIN